MSIATSPKVPAADQTLRMLTYLAAQRGPMPAAGIAHALGLPRSTVYHLLAELIKHGFVLHLPEEQRYGLGTAAWELSGGFMRQQPLARLGRPLVAALVDRVGESGHLAVLHGRDVLYLVEERAPHRPYLVTDVGVRLPAHLTATGRALLAALPTTQQRALYPDDAAFVGRTGSTVTNYPQLRRQLQRVALRGWAEEDGEVTEGMASVGVAVRDHTGWPAAAIAVTFAADRFGAARRLELVGEISRAVAELTRRIRGAVA